MAQKLPKPIREVCLLQDDKSVSVIVCLDQYDKILYVRHDYVEPVDGIATVIVDRSGMSIAFDEHSNISMLQVDADKNNKLFEEIDGCLELLLT